MCLLLALILPAVVAGWVSTHRDATKMTHFEISQRFGSSRSLSISFSSETPRIVVLIPAYNEEKRILSTLESYQHFLEESKWNCEILVVDDGSDDETVHVVDSFPEGKIPIQCIAMPRNGGKGAALAFGIQHVAETSPDTKPLILTQDADGSGNLIYLESMMELLEDLLSKDVDTLDWSKQALVTGNRNYNLFSARGITRWGFQTTVRLIMNDLRVQDSQCGYKLMTLSAAKVLYKDLHLTGWSHDVEVLFRAKLRDIPIQQISIDWKDKDGSKVVASGVARVSMQMLLDVLRLRWEYSVTGAWKPSE
jgi:dolichyl-phosphate beta-glucosyltransferase